MRSPFSSNRRRVSRRPRRGSGRQITTRSGRVLKVNTSLPGRWSEHREAKARRKVERLRGLPKSRLKRMVWRLNPRRQAEYWFSRDGGIMALKIAGIAIFAFFVLSIAVFAFFRKDLKTITDLSNQNLSGSLAFYDRTGKIFLGQAYGTRKRVPVQSNQISHWIKDATVAVEDRDFYNHRGFDVRGIVRAGLNDVIHHGAAQGGSTITQQLVKLSEGWSQKRTLSTKIKEIILAVELERSQSKDEILRQYLNLAPYGGLDYGVQVAAQDYFHVNADKLTLSEAAMLAAIPKSPTIYSPYNKLYFDKKGFLDRYNYVLDSMADTGKISRNQAAKAKKVNILARVHKQPSQFAGIIAPYFVAAAKAQITSEAGDSGPNQTKDTQAWKVITTLDMNMQKLAEQKIKANIPNLYAHLADETASVVEDVQTGQYLAEVGGLDFNQKGYGQLNFAQWPVSPGSSFKPYDYSTLIQNHTDAGAGSVLYDVIGPVPGYPCTNRALPPAGNCLFDFDRRGAGPMTLRYALGGSRNIPAVKAMSEAVPNTTPQQSVDKTIQTAERMMNNGAQYACYKQDRDVTQERKEDQAKCFTSAAIGDGAFLHLDHHVNGLSTLGRMGLSIPATYILRIEDANNKLVTQWKQPHKGDDGVDQVVSPETAYIVNNMLSDPNASYFAFGTKFQSYNGWRIAVKTGTTNNNYDGLMMAYTTKYAVGTWVGYHTRTRSLIGAMENITMPVTRDIIETALSKSGGKPNNWSEPSGIQHLPAFHSAIAYSSQVSPPATDLYPSWYRRPGSISSTSTIDKVSNKLATKCTPSLAKEKLSGNRAPNQFSIDIFYGPRAQSSSANLKQTDDVHSCSDHPPTVTLTISKAAPGKYTVAGTPFAGTHPLNDSHYAQFPGTVVLSINGKQLKTCTKVSEGQPCSSTYKPPASGKQSVSAQVIDSVLYDSTDSTTYSFQAVGSTSSLHFVSAKKTGPTTTIKWSGGVAPYTVTGCGTVNNGTSCTTTGLNPGDPVTVTDKNGDSVQGTVSN